MFSKIKKVFYKITKISHNIFQRIKKNLKQNTFTESTLNRNIVKHTFTTKIVNENTIRRILRMHLELFLIKIFFEKIFLGE